MGLSNEYGEPATNANLIIARYVSSSWDTLLVGRLFGDTRVGLRLTINRNNCDSDQDIVIELGKISVSLGRLYVYSPKQPILQS
jgi:hypothetical protein